MTEIYCLTILESRSPRSRRQQVFVFVFSWGLSPWLVTGHVLFVSSHGLLPVSLSQSHLLTWTLVWLGPPVMTLFCLKYLFKDLLLNMVTFWGTRSKDFNIWMWGTQFSPTHPVWQEVGNCTSHLAATQRWAQDWAGKEQSHRARGQRYLHCSTPCQVEWQISSFVNSVWVGVFKRTPGRKT